MYLLKIQHHSIEFGLIRNSQADFPQLKQKKNKNPIQSMNIDLVVRTWKQIKTSETSVASM